MAGFGDFANIDIEQLLRQGDKQVAQMEQLESVMSGLVGRAQDEDHLVTVEWTAAGLSELQLHPKAMRLSSGELAEKIKEAIRAAGADLQGQMEEASEEIFGKDDNPMKLLTDPDAAMHKVSAAEAVYNQTFDDVMADLGRIRRRLGDGA
ncbi:YbaB/EbfC family DNA-binding protein [Microtetraspora sp. AC03309]|uniref:YbaB/EbfC family DNA-binding protein n=1 Tax=Microtetraspora sp. AC03309 TaxID=2779376 RepID=UPI001E62C9CB|nr:YbaB/EbfC family DNA-binding protein [Microtetraspora sp. AC03309]MCC5577126.1 YbaB/EbfC family DNA-binding protein [Microtetraspora sp. AC03309]